jgi:ABC-type branched-subunit amino acid transport system ATPase component
VDSPLLKADNLTIRFGGVTALNDVSLQVNRGERLAIIGPNGAGKTTLFNVLTGAERIQTGVIRFDGQILRKHSLDSGARRGLVRTFQNVRILPRLTVFENLKVAALAKNRKYADAHLLEELERVQMRDRADMRASDLPYGMQKRLEIVRAMLLEPTILLVDEPVAGLNPTESATVMAAMQEFVISRGTTLVIIEHDMQSVRSIADRALVLDHGQVIASGTPAEVLADPAVVDSYLGAH